MVLNPKKTENGIDMRWIVSCIFLIANEEWKTRFANVKTERN